MPTKAIAHKQQEGNGRRDQGACVVFRRFSLPPTPVYKISLAKEPGGGRGLCRKQEGGDWAKAKTQRGVVAIGEKKREGSGVWRPRACREGGERGRERERRRRNRNGAGGGRGGRPPAPQQQPDPDPKPARRGESGAKDEGFGTGTRARRGRGQLR